MAGVSGAGGDREALVRLGSSGASWRFCPGALRFLEACPEDAEVALLLAANLARLGLRTAGESALARCAGLLGEGHPDVEAVGGALRGLPDDKVGVEERVRRVRMNLEALSDRGINPGEGVARWEARTRGERWLRASDGNVVRQRVGEDSEGRGLGGWIRFADERGQAAGVAIPRASGDGGAGDRSVRPVYVHGMDPPWLLERLHAALASAADGYAPPITMVEPEVDALLDGLALADLRSILRAARLSLFVGSGAIEELRAHLRGRLGCEIRGEAMALPRAQASAWRDAVRATVDEACDAQRSALERARSVVEGRAASRGVSWWASRWESAIGGSGEGLRVLIPSCRYSTYVRHASEDIACAFERAGCEVEVLIEADDSSRLASVAYAEACARVDPDLIVLINYPRASMGGAIPEGVPFVCWVQDAMPQMFDRGAARSQGALDFLVGGLDPAYFRHVGHPRERSLHLPVPASEAKFHDGAVDGARRERFGCEIACVTHHSERPEDQRDRLARSARGGPFAGAIGEIWEGCVTLRDDLGRGLHERRLAEIVRRALGRVGGGSDEATVAHVMATHALPMLDRLIRHQTLEWARSIAARRGWRFHIYGRGWERHPALGAYARGEVAHGEDLRAAYRCAAATLHASAHTLLHQRVMECALSGGLTLARLKFNDLHIAHRHGRRAIAGDASVRTGATGDGDIGAGSILVADHWLAMRMAAQQQRLGYPARARIGLPGRGAAGADLERFWILGDLAETTFMSEAGLEALLEKAVERPVWRADLVAGIRGRVRRHMTYERGVERILELVGSSLAREAARAGEGAEGAASVGDRAA